MAPTIIQTETHSTSTLSPKNALSYFTLMETTPTTQEKTTTLNNYYTVSWDTLPHQKLTMNPTIAALTKKYCD